MFLEWESTVIIGKKHYLRPEIKANIKQGIIILQYIKIYANTYAERTLTTMKKGFFHCVKRTNQLSFKLITKKWSNTQEATGYSMAPNTTQTISWKACYICPNVKWSVIIVGYQKFQYRAMHQEIILRRLLSYGRYVWVISSNKLHVFLPNVQIKMVIMPITIISGAIC